MSDLDIKDSKYKIFKQMIKVFYNDDNNKQIEKKEDLVDTKKVKIQPKIIYSSFNKTLKIEFQIGINQMYKLKNLPEFYERMLKNESYKYGSRLEFVHKEECFEEESKPLLKYIIKYAEIIKYANEASSSYGHYGSTLKDNYITISNSGLDEIFEILKNQNVNFEKEYEETNIFFEDKEPEIKFDLEDLENGEYRIVPNIDLFSYEIIEGKKYKYFLYKNALYKISEEFENTIFKLLEIYRKNYTNEIVFQEKDLSKLFSIIFPKIKSNLNLEKVNKDKINKYIPKELAVKLYLDYNADNNILGEVKFVYGDVEFNPLSGEKVNIARNIAKENKILSTFINTGFMLDKTNNRMILVNDNNIYNFLSSEIESYMREFEVLVTDKFKQKEIHQSQIGTIGVKIDNNLLKIDLNDLGFDIRELEEIMKKYRVKQKYHRLKDGSFIEFEGNPTIQFISDITDAIGEMSMPLYRSMYLDRLLQGLKNTNIVKSVEYKKMVDNIEKRESDEEIEIPKKLYADLRNYQKTGYKWLMLLDKYKLGGILADDMGLR